MKQPSRPAALIQYFALISFRSTTPLRYQRIAVFDNDGALWVEQPMYTQMAFALQRVKDLAPEQVVGSTLEIKYIVE